MKDNNIGMDANEMSNRFLSSIQETFEKWKPRSRFEIMEVV